MENKKTLLHEKRAQASVSGVKLTSFEINAGKFNRINTVLKMPNSSLQDNFSFKINQRSYSNNVL